MQKTFPKARLCQKSNFLFQVMVLLHFPCANHKSEADYALTLINEML